MKDNACDLKRDWSINYTDRLKEQHFKHCSILLPLHFDSFSWTTL